MAQYKFLITNYSFHAPENIRNTILLGWDNWNDYGYFTSFRMSYVDSYGKFIEIGSVKIAKKNLEKGYENKVLDIGDRFESLDEDFFSLGTDDTYYENLNNISEELRNFVLLGLNDIALDTDLFKEVVNEEVTQLSLLRGVSYNTVVNQYNRIAKGGVRLTDYSFTYLTSENNQIDFKVTAYKNPPTNIQIIIGRNGVGKSTLLNNMIDSIFINEENVNSRFKFDITNNESDTFSNIINVTFSAFDNYRTKIDNIKKDIDYHFIGLKNNHANNENSLNDFAKDFVSSIEFIMSSKRLQRWKRIVEVLESDPIFREENFINYIDSFVNKVDDTLDLESKFNKLSSGHKIILLTITKLVELAQEKSLIFFDEPETHLHPPLLSSFIRGLSELLTDRNAVCIMTTHSPIILQEVPRSCVYKLSRMGDVSKYERLNVESFGENIGVLTNEVFGLEVTESGFYKILKDIVNQNETYEEALNSIDKQLGVESKAILRSLFFDKENNEKY